MKKEILGQNIGEYYFDALEKLECNITWGLLTFLISACNVNTHLCGQIYFTCNQIQIELMGDQ